MTKFFVISCAVRKLKIAIREVEKSEKTRTLNKTAAEKSKSGT